MDWSAPDDSTRSDEPIGWALRLCAAITRRAVVDYKLYSNHESPRLARIGDEAMLWIYDDESTDVGSFVFVCEAMGLPPDAVRARIESISEEQIRRLRGMEFGDDC